MEDLVKHKKVSKYYENDCWLVSDAKLTFNHHIKVIISKVNKGIATIRKLTSILPRNALITIYKFFIRRPETILEIRKKGHISLGD